MVKKNFCYIILIFIFLCNSFSQSVVVVDSVEEQFANSKKILIELEKLSEDFLSTKNETYIIEYSKKVKLLFVPEIFMSEFQSYLVVESLYYWNFLRNVIDIKEIKKDIDNSVNQLWMYLKKANLYSTNSLFAIKIMQDYVSVYKNYSSKQFFLPMEIKLPENVNNELELDYPSENKIKINFLHAISKADYLLEKYEQQNTTNVLTDKALTNIVNEPAVLYCILTQIKYKKLLDSIILTCSQLSGFPQNECERILQDSYSDKYLFSDSIIFTKDMYDLLYSICNKDTIVNNMIYDFSNNIIQSYMKSLSNGVMMQNVFSESEMNIINLLLTNPPSIFCLSQDTINFMNIKVSFLNQIKLKERIINTMSKSE